MNIEEIRTKLLVDPFDPSRLYTTNGREYLVRHPDCVLVGPYSIALLDEDGHILTLAAEHIVGIKDEPRKKNGAKKH